MANKVRRRVYNKFSLNSARNNCTTITVVGIVNTTAFQKARICAEKLSEHLPYKFTKPKIIEMFQMDWHDYISKMQREIGGHIWSLAQTVAVFMNGEFLGNDVEFIRYMSQNYIFTLPFGVQYYEDLAIKRSKELMDKSKRKYVYFTISVNNVAAGSFVFMLYFDLLPITCQHFINLCTGYNAAKQCYTDPYYINTRVQRIVKNGWIQCGGVGPSRINNYNPDDVSPVFDESYCILHDRRGVLSMAHDGKHSNRSQFTICLKPNPWMNQFYVAFGQLIDGKNMLEALENIPTYYECPKKEIKISQCGEFIFGDEIRMETKSQVFLKHQLPPSIEGEDIATSDVTFDYYSITSWLDNVVDKIDVRDTASILMAERYLNGLYCLSNDYQPGMDMRVYEKMNSIGTKNSASIMAKLHDLLLNFQPDIITDKEKMNVLLGISDIILAYMFYHEYNEFCLKHISLSTYATINKILEIAHDISLKIIQKAENKAIIRADCGISEIAKIFEAKHANKVLVSEGCLLLLEDILNKAILCLMKIYDTGEQ